jgi:hypothetical protein
MLADFLWCFFMIAGIEHVQIKQGMGAANYIGALSVPYSHSLLMIVGWALLFAAAYFLRRHYSRGALVILIAVLSHWFLDFVAHPPDMPLAPGLQKFFGLGLWNSVPATLIIEGGFWLLAIILYARATHPQKRIGTYAFWIVIALLTLAWYNNIAGPPPKDPSHMGISSLIFFSQS